MVADKQEGNTEGRGQKNYPCSSKGTCGGLGRLQRPRACLQGLESERVSVLAYLHEAQQLDLPQKLGFVGC